MPNYLAEMDRTPATSATAIAAAAVPRISLLCWPYLLLLVVALIMPSDGNHGLFSPKSLSFLLACASTALLLLIQRSISISQIKVLAFSLFTAAFLVAWIFFSAINSYADWAGQSDQAKLFLITISVPIMALSLVWERLITPQAILKTVFYANFFYCASKLLLVVGNALGLISLWSAMNLLGFRFMQMGIYGGLERVQTSVDIVTPFIIFFVLKAGSLGVKLPRWFVWLYLFVSCLATFLSFSRFLIFVYVCSIALFMLTLPMRRFLRWAVAALSLLSIAVVYIGWEPVASVVEKRLFSNDSYQSDEVRVDQMRYLWQEHEKYPWLGKGVGGSVDGYVRDYQLPHSYEVQWAAFLMQFGVIGLLILWIPLFLIAWRFIAMPLSGEKAAFLALFGLWIFSGFTNPFLISLTSGVVYTIFYLAGEQPAEV